MKKLFTNKNFIQKVIIAIVIMLLVTFSVPTRSSADPGGVLLGPVFDLLSSIGDVFLAGLNAFLVDGEFVPDGRRTLGYNISKVGSSTIYRRRKYR